MLNKFKELVDNVSPTLFTEEDFMNEYHVDVEEEPIHYMEDALFHDLKIKIEDLNFPSGRIDRITFNDLTEELIYREILFNENSISYLEIIKSFISVNGRMERFPSFDDEKWIDVVVSLKNYLNFRICEKPLSKENIKDYYLKEYNRAQSVKYLMDKGCKIELDNNKIKFVSGLNEILNGLDSMIEDFGGINLIIEIFHNVEYSEQFQRFIFLKTSSVLNQNTELEIPWGYLFNLALKHPKFKFHSKKIKYQNLFNNIINLSSKIVNAICNVQQYNVFEHIFQNVKTFPQSASDLVLYDSLFRIPQSNFDLELKLCECYYSFENNFFEDILGFSIDEFILVINDLKKYFHENNNSIIVELSKEKEYILPYEKYLQILEFISHELPINENYLLPSDYLKIDFFKKPLIRLDQRRFFIPNISVACPNFYEVLAYALREPFKEEFNINLDSLFGDRLESLIKSLFDEKGISYISNCEYSYEEYNGETDFIIESDKSIIIIEVKKKPLRRESRSGFNYRIFMDLFGSFVHSQFQANKLEYLLKRYGDVELKLEDESIYRLTQNGRHVKRISLTQFDYGSLYNPNFLEFFLKTLIIGEYALENVDETLNQEFENFKRNIDGFKESFDKLNEIEKVDFKAFAHLNTYFICISQLFEIIKRSNDNDSFHENLPNQFIESGTFDWFFEYGKFVISR